MATQEVKLVSTDLKISIERMTEHDLLEVVEIEEAAGLSPWGWDAYHKELQSPEDVVMLVARTRRADDEVIAGFIVSRLVGEDLHINNVAVRSEFQKRGIGRRLLERALEWGRLKGSASAFLEVRAGNSAAQGLYRRCGFQVTGHRRRYYNAPVEDALLMSVSLKS